MKTANELKDSAYYCHAENGDVVAEGYLFSVEDFAIFWSQLCKEQRYLCAERFDKNSDIEIPIQNKILTAKEPNLE